MSNATHRAVIIVESTEDTDDVNLEIRYGPTEEGSQDDLDYIPASYEFVNRVLESVFNEASDDIHLEVEEPRSLN